MAKNKRPTDINEKAFSIVAIATGQMEDPIKPPSDAIKAAASALGRLGGLKGGKARAAKLTPERRAEIAKKAASKRWERRK